jgi:hypothetical protein
MLRRRAVGEEENLVVRLVAGLHRRARMNGDKAAGLDVDALRRIFEQQRERSAQRHEYLFLHRIDVPSAAHVRRIAPHPCARLGEVGRIRHDCMTARGGAVRGLALEPLEILLVNDVEGHGATIPSAPVARMSYPRAGEPRPAALPPGQRTIGQLVAESIRLYGSRFWAVIPLGVPLAAEHASTIGQSTAVQTLLLWAFGPLWTAAYVYACTLTSAERPRRRVLLSAYLVGLIVFLPFPILLRLYVLPAIALFGLLGLAVPAAVYERLGVRAALRRGWQLGRADVVHAIGGMATLALVYGVSRLALLVLLHTQAEQTQNVAGVLADLVLSPLLFIGATLLYVDQAARVEKV